MRVLVCGGRDYDDYDSVHRELSIIAPSEILNGGCPTGADAHARKFAAEMQRVCITVPARWRHHGRSAGPLRNEVMLMIWEPDLVLAFPGGRGTADMVSRAERAGCKVVRVSS